MLKRPIFLSKCLLERLWVGGGRVGEKKTKLMLYSTQLKLKLKLELSLAIITKYVGTTALKTLVHNFCWDMNLYA